MVSQMTRGREMESQRRVKREGAWCQVVGLMVVVAVVVRRVLEAAREVGVGVAVGVSPGREEERVLTMMGDVMKRC